MNLIAMFTIGLLGSVHCLGMCGGFAIAVGTVPLRVPGERPPILPGLLRQAIYSGGRLFTYAFLGAAAGLLGARLARTELPLVGSQQVLAIVAGALMIYIGLNTLGVRVSRLWRRTRQPVAPGRVRSPGGAAPDRAPGGGLFTSLLAQFINARGPLPFLLAGVLTGFLPCGLVYIALAKATQSADPLSGALAMIAFGAGTAPAMVALGCGSTLLSAGVRQRVLQLAACFVILLGGVTVYRGIPYEKSCCANRAAHPSPPAP